MCVVVKDSIKLTRKQCNTSNFMTSTNIYNILKYANVHIVCNKIIHRPCRKVKTKHGSSFLSKIFFTGNDYNSDRY